MRKTPVHKDADTIAHGRELLQEMKEVCTSLLYATVLTDDGFEVVRLPEADAEDGRMASMASSIQALGEAVARELAIGSDPYVIVAAGNGHLIQHRVQDQPLVLAALFGSDEALGKALVISRRFAGRMSAYLAEKA
jgi:predicted regulator of Ras-like GTPase activity (Roadblock/LC7/MglB family)